MNVLNVNYAISFSRFRHQIWLLFGKRECSLLGNCLFFPFLQVISCLDIVFCLNKGPFLGLSLWLVGLSKLIEPLGKRCLLLVINEVDPFHEESIARVAIPANAHQGLVSVSLAAEGLGYD